MTKLLLVVGSARKGRVADKVLSYVQEEVAKRDTIQATVADLTEVNLPFFDNERSPSDPAYVPTNERVIAWGKTVADADAVLFITPEYNHSLSAIQKNAIDSLFVEWNDKPAAVAAYGWSAGSHSVAAIRELAPVVKLDLKEPLTELGFTKELNPDGSLIDEAGVRAQINATLDALTV